MAKSLRRNPGWKLEPETIDIVAAARGVLGLTNAEVVHAWAMAWQEQQAAQREAPGPMAVLAIAAVNAVARMQEKPLAVRVETPYQIARREHLERLREQLEGGTEAVSGALGEVAEAKGSDAVVLPFDVVVNGENHRVREFHGRRVLEWVGPKVNVMKKNLTPQETVIYWRQRVR